MTDAMIVHSESDEAQYEECLADWLTKGLEKPGKLNVRLAQLLDVGPTEISKMKSNKRKILAYQLFKIAAYIEEPFPVPADTPVNILGQTIQIIGEAGRPAWYDGEPVAISAERIPFNPDDRYRDLLHFAVKIVGDDVNTIIPDGSHAVCVGYWAARKVLTDQDFVLIKEIHNTGGLHKRLIRQVASLPKHFELRGASYDPKLNAANTIRLPDVWPQPPGASEAIEVVGLVVSTYRRIEK